MPNCARSWRRTGPRFTPFCRDAAPGKGAGPGGLTRLARLAALVLCGALPARAEIVPPQDADIYILGEVHDNPAHHEEQARLVRVIGPAAVVWEMLSPDQAQALPAVAGAEADAMAAALGWEASGWPDFAMYHPIFVAAGTARHVAGAAPVADLRAVMEGGLEAVLDAGTRDLWALGPLPRADQAAREAEQMAAHCDALPAALMPGMVAAQRLRDWQMAQAAVTALAEGDRPVVIITGTGHARRDSGIPALIAAARPDLRVWSLGQTEGADPTAASRFDAVNVTPPAPREDPCLAFRTGD